MTVPCHRRLSGLLDLCYTLAFPVNTVHASSVRNRIQLVPCQLHRSRENGTSTLFRRQTCDWGCFVSYVLYVSFISANILSPLHSPSYRDTAANSLINLFVRDTIAAVSWDPAAAQTRRRREYLCYALGAKSPAAVRVSTVQATIEY